MTDKELLELAAKAAGYQLDGLASRYIAQGVGVDDFLELNDSGGHSVWNPLTNDGDALRLAVRLRLRVCCPTSDSDCALASNGDVTAYSEDDLTDIPMSDLYAATRRAIVRAAAEIGKAMP